MVRFKIKAYDNGWSIPMSISLGLGLTCVAGGFYGDYGEGVGWFGVACLVAFLFFKYMNYRAAQDRVVMKKIRNTKTGRLDKELEDLINSNELENFINRMNDSNNNDSL